MALKVGFIGLGIMGSRMAANLRTHNYVAKEVYQLAMREGYADQDFAALYAFLNEAARDQRSSAHGPGRG